MMCIDKRIARLLSNDDVDISSALIDFCMSVAKKDTYKIVANELQMYNENERDEIVCCVAKDVIKEVGIHLRDVTYGSRVNDFVIDLMHSEVGGILSLEVLSDKSILELLNDEVEVIASYEYKYTLTYNYTNDIKAIYTYFKPYIDCKK